LLILQSGLALTKVRVTALELSTVLRRATSGGAIFMALRSLCRTRTGAPMPSTSLTWA
jgi:hypothetical protein